jgi:hypothetical protein
MDLNSAIHTAECGGNIRDDSLMAEGWSIRFVKEDKLLYYFNPEGEKAHKVRFYDVHRASFQWRTTINGE